jgi:hypothetical protein
MGAKEPQRLGDALTLLVSGIFATRLTCAGAEQLDSVHDAAMALLDSPLGVPPPKPARRR